jgi:hypothetical protein
MQTSTKFKRSENNKPFEFLDGSQKKQALKDYKHNKNGKNACIRKCMYISIREAGNF